MNARDVSLYTAAAVGGAIVMCSVVVVVRVLCQHCACCGRGCRLRRSARAPDLQSVVAHRPAGRPPPYSISGSLRPHAPRCPIHGAPASGSPYVQSGLYAHRPGCPRAYTGAPPYSALFGPGGSESDWTATNTPPPSYNEAVNSEAYRKQLSNDLVCQRI